MQGDSTKKRKHVSYFRGKLAARRGVAMAIALALVASTFGVGSGGGRIEWTVGGAGDAGGWADKWGGGGEVSERGGWADKWADKWVGEGGADGGEGGADGFGDGGAHCRCCGLGIGEQSKPCERPTRHGRFYFTRRLLHA